MRKGRDLVGSPAAVGAVRINGQDVPLDGVPANWTLADLIRYRTTLRGTHLACEHGVCGVCTVLLDGEPVRSCLVLSHAVGDRQVTTVEGLDLIDADLAARLRTAFLSRNAFQCGFCTPGMLTLVFAAAHTDACPPRHAADAGDGRPAAGSASVARQVIDANLCRCTGYSAIVAAAGDVLEQARGAEADARADR
jgi:aerobic carbon-monoxide dehydrogenase small subunit